MSENNFTNTVESLFKGMDAFITTKTVVGDAIHIGDTIILPLVDVSFWCCGRSVFHRKRKITVAGGMGGKNQIRSAVLVIQNDVGNRHSPTVICAAITSRMNKAKLPTHVEIDAKRYRIVKDSVVLLEQIRTIDKQRLKDYVCRVDKELMRKVDEALCVSLMLHT